MLKRLKLQTLSRVRAAGAFRSCSNSAWRQRRLLLIGYHGISVGDEHQWNPGYYMSQQTFIERMELLREHECTVLPLSDALARLDSGTLPPRSVCLTFDDGLADFHSRALPVLLKFGFPSTVYLTTYYAGLPYPVSPVIRSYILWKSGSRNGRLRELESTRDMEEMSAPEQDRRMSELATQLGVDYQQIKTQRILQLMSEAEVRQISESGVDVQLHTHRHCTPADLDQTRREIQENRAKIVDMTGTYPTHFCYPNGIWNRELLPWLSECGIRSGVTCRPALATADDHRLLLPRLVDSGALSSLEFESWIAGVGGLLSVRNRWS